MLYLVTLSYACFGIVVLDGYIATSAPIGKWMVGKTLAEVESWISKKKGTIEYISGD